MHCLSYYIVLSAVAIHSKKDVGGHGTFPCSFSWASTNNKYFCKETCSGEDILVETKGSRNVTQGRYSIDDDGNGHVTVTIKDLKKSDSGTYWCGVERFGPDSYQEVHLTVTDDSPGTGQTLMVWTRVGVVVMVTVMGLVLTLFCIKRRGSRRQTSPQLVYKNTKTAPSGEERGNKQPKPPQPVYYNTNTAPSGEERGNKQPKPPQPVYYNTNTAPSGEEKVDRLYENTRKPRKKRYVAPVIPINSPNASTNPADHAPTTNHADHAPTTNLADHAPTTNLADHTSTTYPAGQVTRAVMNGMLAE
ncbi:CMRF35-like molecule 9 [Esox lucius]|uniref:CMRF35-like molecule 9 n=1 Tax=Esox lucius TaxID=8010 RepID=UPI0014777DD1|nr:CMRF35-like molecule 9 [Esox lucius]